MTTENLNETVARVMGRSCVDDPPGSGKNCPVHNGPNYTDDANALAEVKREIERRGWGWRMTRCLGREPELLFEANIWWDRLPAKFHHAQGESEAHALLTAFVAAHKESMEVQG